MKLFVLASIAAIAAVTPTVAQKGGGNIDNVTKGALIAALDQERRGEAFYKAVLKNWKGALPFANVVLAEGRHIDSVASTMKSFGLQIPANPWTNYKFQLPGNLKDACLISAKDEVDGAAAYEAAVAKLSDPRVTALFDRLAYVNVEHHAAAFLRTANGEPCGGQGSGQGWGNGPGAGVCDGTGPKGKGKGGGKISASSPNADQSRGGEAAGRQYDTAGVRRFCFIRFAALA